MCGGRTDFVVFHGLEALEDFVLIGNGVLPAMRENEAGAQCWKYWSRSDLRFQLCSTQLRDNARIITVSFLYE